MAEDKFIVVFMTAPGAEEAASIGKKVVEERLAACCNVIGGVRSIYTWQGEVCDEGEVLCIFKTRASLFGALKDRIVELHGYDVPEVIAVDIVSGHADYLAWISGATGDVAAK